MTDEAKKNEANAPVPAPKATPAPRVVTLHEAQAWALSLLNASVPTITLAAAREKVKSGLAKNWPKTAR